MDLISMAISKKDRPALKRKGSLPLSSSPFLLFCIDGRRSLLMLGRVKEMTIGESKYFRT